MWTNELRSDDFKGGSLSSGGVQKEREGGARQRALRVSKRYTRGNEHGTIHPVSLWLDGALDGSLHSAGEATIEGRRGISGQRGRKGKAGG